MTFLLPHLNMHTYNCACVGVRVMVCVRVCVCCFAAQPICSEI